MRIRRFAPLALLALVWGCAPSTPEAQTAITKPVVLDKDTKITLMLLEPLESGVTPEGEEATLMVAEDVKGPDGAIVVPKGSLAVGKVSWSRRADTVSAITNRPARLAVELQSVEAPDGTDIAIDAVEEDNGAYQFTRGNTGRTGMSARIEELWRTDEGRELLTQVQELIEKGQNLDSAENAELLKQAVEKLELPKAGELLREGRIGEVQGLLDKLKSGSGLADLAAKNLIGIGAVMELASLAGDVGDKLGGMLKGANIKAHVGTTIEAVVAESVTIKPK